MSGDTRVPARIAGTGSVPAGRAITTAEIVARVGGGLDVAEVEAKTGIATREFADPDATAADLGARALRIALGVAAIPPERLERIIFVSSLGGDVLVPATANLVAAALGLRDTCDCFDLNNACMGFLSAFDTAARAVATGLGPVGIVVAELASRYLAPEEPRAFLVVGDAIAAAVVTEAAGREGILGWSLRNDGTAAGDVALPHPGLTGKREVVRLVTPNRELARLAVEYARARAEEALAHAGLAMDDVDWVLPHQPNGVMLGALIDALGVDPERVVPVVREIGSVGAASIPVSLDRLMRSGRVRPGDRILLVGVGAGRAHGAIVVQT